SGPRAWSTSPSRPGPRSSPTGTPTSAPARPGSRRWPASSIRSWSRAGSRPRWARRGWKTPSAWAGRATSAPPSPSTPPAEPSPPPDPPPDRRCFLTQERQRMSFLLHKTARRGVLANPHQVDDEDEGLVGADGATCTPGAVAQLGWDGEPAAAADLHAGHALVPAADDHARAEAELERLAA